MAKDAPHLLIVEARFYEGLSEALLDGAKAALDEAGATYDVVTVPGALNGPSTPLRTAATTNQYWPPGSRPSSV